MSLTSKVVRVGGVEVPFQTAAGWVKDYLNAAANRTRTDPYAYPAYDDYDAERNEPNRLSDGDLLAPTLLNVKVSIRSFYGMQAIRDRLEKALVKIGVSTRLADCSVDDMRHLTGALYEVLDGPPERQHGVRLTTLSKVLHRKRPEFLALHDKWVRACYQDAPTAPVVPVKGRPTAEYMLAITEAIRTDLLQQADLWTQLGALAQPDENARTVGHLRLLDIVAWNAGSGGKRTE